MRDKHLFSALGILLLVPIGFAFFSQNLSDILAKIQEIGKSRCAKSHYAM
jgi:hypothetical protein